MSSRVRAGNLTAALVLVAAMELLLNRLANRLFLPRSLVSGAGAGATLLARIVGDSGPFLFHLTGVLALLVLGMALGGLLRRRELFPEPVLARVIVGLIGFAFWATAALIISVGQVRRGFLLPLQAAFGFLSLLTAGAFLRARAPWRAKVGVLLFALPAVLHVASTLLDRFGLTGPRRGGGGLAPWVEASLIVAAATAPFTLVRKGTERWRWPPALAVAGVLTVVLAVAMRARYDLMQAMALYGPHLEIPRLSSWLGIAYLVAALGWCFAVVRLVLEPGGARLAGYGLLLLGIGGYPLGSPIELSIGLLGLLSLAVGQLRLHRASDAVARDGVPALGRSEWRSWIGRLATAAHDGSAPELGPPEAVVVEEDDLEASRIRAHRRGRSVGIRFLRRRGRITELDVTIGDPGHREPSATIERHRNWLARSPDQRLPLPRAKTGDSNFDQRFSVHGAVALGGDTVRQRIMRHDDGLFSVWSGAAARYHASTGHADSGAMLDLVDLLNDLIDASGAPAAE